jgi:cardiolipin synthase A/B
MAKAALRSLVVLPDDSAQPILEAIQSAQRSVRVKIFALSDPTIVRTLIEAHKRGVRTRVMLDPTREGRDRQREVARRRLERAGLEVRDSNPEFSATHEKSMVVDDAHAFVQSCNWETENFTRTRDYAVHTRDAAEVKEIVHGFEADWARQPFKPQPQSSLIWSPWNGRERISDFIDRAAESLVVQNERFQDSYILEHLVRATLRGVKVHMLSRPVHSLSADSLTEGVGGLRILRDAGVKIHKLDGLKLHAKMLLADDARAIVGSINLSVGSFDKRRELAIEMADDAIVDRLRTVAHDDWKNSKPLDLSDEALLSDLERHHRDDVLARWRAADPEH